MAIDGIGGVTVTGDKVIGSLQGKKLGVGNARWFSSRVNSASMAACSSSA
jgi:hypothetical protein